MSDNKFASLIKNPNLVVGVVSGGTDDGQTFWFDGTPQNIASFLMKHADADRIQITTALDMPILCSFGCFIDRCANQSLLTGIMEYLVPMQMGEATPEDFFCPTYEEVEASCSD